MERGYKYGFPHFGLKNHADSTPSISTRFLFCTLLYIRICGLGRGDASKEGLKGIHFDLFKAYEADNKCYIVDVIVFKLEWIVILII